MECYKGNPFIESLPPILDKQSFFLKIAEKPELKFTDNLIDNLAYVNQIRNSFFVPLSYHYFLYAKIYNLFREVYRIRTPIEWIKKLNEIKRWADDPSKLPQKISMPPSVRKLMLGFSFLGVPGMGKTTSLDKIFSLFDQVIPHKDLGLTQVPHLSIECTIKGSTKHLCSSFFDELDHILPDEKFGQKYGRDSEEKLMIQMANKILLLQIGILRIEEVHNICASSPSARQVIMNFFKTLANRIGIPIIYVGIKDAAPILYGNYQSASRGEGIGMEPLVPFKQNDKEWEYFLDKLWNCQIFPNPGPLTDEIKRVYHERSDGVLRQVIQVHCNAQEIALFNNCNSLTIEHIKSTSKALPVTTMAITGFRNRNRVVMKHFDDLQMTSAYVFKDEDDSTSTSKSQQESKKLFEFAKKQWPKISYAQLDEIISSILAAYAELPIDKKFEKLTDGINNLDRQDKLECQPKLGDPKGDLIDMCVNVNTSQDHYSILVQNGIIPDLADVAVV